MHKWAKGGGLSFPQPTTFSSTTTSSLSLFPPLVPPPPPPRRARFVFGFFVFFSVSFLSPVGRPRYKKGSPAQTERCFFWPLLPALHPAKMPADPSSRETKGRSHSRQPASGNLWYITRRGLCRLSGLSYPRIFSGRGYAPSVATLNDCGGLSESKAL
ncbi:MAG: hypothetical protein BJ554DRAFT_3755 [Olpidium bornovanus]|uniref:Uncharacterized protein n=1 Tax=Olpidium bornovanus TaxID=278681 RepID=A0A8H8DLH3_9FUNG|nr:MAG: hypothetical protein BJ554DRAFT_3755 [Olpidium bornovanus]